MIPTQRKRNSEDSWSAQRSDPLARVSTAVRGVLALAHADLDLRNLSLNLQRLYKKICHSSTIPSDFDNYCFAMIRLAQRDRPLKLIPPKTLDPRAVTLLEIVLERKNVLWNCLRHEPIPPGDELDQIFSLDAKECLALLARSEDLVQKVAKPIDAISLYAFVFWTKSFSMENQIKLIEHFHPAHIETINYYCNKFNEYQVPQHAWEAIFTAFIQLEPSKYFSFLSMLHLLKLYVPFSQPPEVIHARALEFIQPFHSTLFLQEFLEVAENDVDKQNRLFLWTEASLILPYCLDDPKLFRLALQLPKVQNKKLLINSLEAIDKFERYTFATSLASFVPNPNLFLAALVMASRMDEKNRQLFLKLLDDKAWSSRSIVELLVALEYFNYESINNLLTSCPSSAALSRFISKIQCKSKKVSGSSIIEAGEIMGRHYGVRKEQRSLFEDAFIVAYCNDPQLLNELSTDASPKKLGEFLKVAIESCSSSMADAQTFARLVIDLIQTRYFDKLSASLQEVYELAYYVSEINEKPQHSNPWGRFHEKLDRSALIYPKYQLIAQASYALDVEQFKETEKKFLFDKSHLPKAVGPNSWKELCALLLDPKSSFSEKAQAWGYESHVLMEPMANPALHQLLIFEQDKVTILQMQFACIVNYLMEKRDIDAILAFIAQVQFCKSGREEGICRYYNQLPRAYKFTILNYDDDPELNKAHSLLAEVAQEFLNAEMMNSQFLEKVSETKALQHESHITQFVKNQIAHHIGLRHTRTFDLYLDIIPEALLKQDTSSIADIFYDYALPSKLADSLALKFNAAVGKEKQDMYNQLNLLSSSIWSLDETIPYAEENPLACISLQPEKALELLHAAGYLKKIVH